MSFVPRILIVIHTVILLALSADAQGFPGFPKIPIHDPFRPIVQDFGRFYVHNKTSRHVRVAVLAHVHNHQNTNVHHWYHFRPGEKAYLLDYRNLDGIYAETTDPGPRNWWGGDPRQDAGWKQNPGGFVVRDVVAVSEMKPVHASLEPYSTDVHRLPFEPIRVSFRTPKYTFSITGGGVSKPPPKYGDPINMVSKNPPSISQGRKEHALVRIRNRTNRNLRFFVQWYPGHNTETINAAPNDEHFFWITSRREFWDAMKRGWPKVVHGEEVFSAKAGVDIIRTNGRPPRMNDREGTYEKIMVFQDRHGHLGLMDEPF